MRICAHGECIEEVIEAVVGYASLGSGVGVDEEVSRLGAPTMEK